MKIKSASLFGLTLALAVIAFAAPAQARDNNGYGNYLSSGINNNSGSSCDRGNNRGNDHDGGHHRRGQRAFGNQFQNQFGNQNQVGIYPNTPFAGNTAYGNNQNLGYNTFANSPAFLNQRAQLQQQLSYGNLSARDRNKLLNRLAKLEAKAFNNNNGLNGNNGYSSGILSNLRNQYFNNGTLNNGNFNTGINSGFLNNNGSLANAGYVNQVRGMLGF
ncbi:hypothetical protein KBI23_27145 [bacterium]|nr:hypothetical protein [bacterium]MBP9811095.1 hypothetical protein [bacterium]